MELDCGWESDGCGAETWLTSASAPPGLRLECPGAPGEGGGWAAADVESGTARLMCDCDVPRGLPRRKEPRMVDRCCWLGGGVESCGG